MLYNLYIYLYMCFYGALHSTLPLSHTCQEKEVSSGASAPRILSIDPYFITEVEKVEKDPDTKRRVKKVVEEYEYDEAMEPSYMESMFRQFNKTLEEGFFNLIVVDAVNHRVSKAYIVRPCP